MNDDNIISLYECPICHAQYRKKKFCLRCVESHNGELIVREIELSTSMHSPNLQDYKFFGSTHRCKADFKIDNDVSCHGLYGGWPNFKTECLDTPEEVRKAKRRLLEAALVWADKYVAKIREMQAAEEVRKAKRRLLEAALVWADKYVAKIREMQAALEQGGDDEN